jgi:glycopeptide antibiotics resistance protein
VEAAWRVSYVKWKGTAIGSIMYMYHLLWLCIIYVYIITMPYMLYNFLQLHMAEECLLHATDLSGLLLLYSSLGDAGGITKLASVAKEQGKNNVAFLCFFMLGKLEECLQLLIERYRHWDRTILVSCLIHLLV